MIIAVLLLILGFACLLISADWLVKGASSLAKRFNVPEIVIGLTIVAFGTSAPELCVNIVSNFKGASEICFGDPIGSNIFNILIILGITGLICPLAVKKATTWIEIPYSLLGAVVLLLLANDTWFRPDATNGLSRIDSLILLFFFALFLVYTARLTKKGDVEAGDVKLFSLPVTVSAIIVGLVGLIFGGKIVVSQAVMIASSLGVSQKMIALTIVAGGTSLPELATSVTAALKKHPDIAIGNIVGSNIFNIMLILGFSSMLKPLPYNNMFNTDIYVLFVTSAVLFLFMFSVKKLRLDRIEGAIFLLMYVAYVVFFLK